MIICFDKITVPLRTMSNDRSCWGCTPIRDFPDHATFREKGAKLACADKLGVFLSLTLCNKANFDPLQQVKHDGLEKNVKQEKMYESSSFS